MHFREYLLVISVCGVTTIGTFLSGSVTVALPTIGNALSFKQADLQWPLNVYALSYGCTLLFFARLADVFGSKKLFLAGSSWFAVWSLATAFAPNDKAFIIFMALKGVGAAAYTPAGISVVSAYFEAGPTKNRVFGAVGAGQPVGFILGLVLGGILCDSSATWRAIYYIQAALSISFSALAIISFPPDDTERRYRKGLDWGGAVLSTVAVALLNYSLSESTAQSKGWKAPYIPSIFVASIALVALFVVYEIHREKRGYSVILPMSIWKRPGAKMGSIMLLVFFAWWSFNTLAYFATLYYQQVIALSPIQTSVRFIPMALSGFVVNVLAGVLIDYIPGQPLVLLGLLGNIAAPMLFALINVHSSYWAMAFLVMVFVVGADVAYTVANLHICNAMDRDSQALAGGIFNMTTRMGTSLGLAITSSIATSVSNNYFNRHPYMPPNSPSVLMEGFRAAGWTCFATGALSFAIGAVGLRGIGYVGKKALDQTTGEGDVSSLPFDGQTQTRDIPMTPLEKPASRS